MMSLFQEIDKANHILRQKIDELIGTLIVSQETVDAQAAQIGTLAEAYLELTEKLGQKTGQCFGLQLEVKELEEQLAERDVRIAELEANAKALQSIIKERDELLAERN